MGTPIIRITITGLAGTHKSTIERSIERAASDDKLTHWQALYAIRCIAEHTGKRTPRRMIHALMEDIRKLADEALEAGNQAGPVAEASARNVCDGLGLVEAVGPAGVPHTFKCPGCDGCGGAKAPIGKGLPSLLREPVVVSGVPTGKPFLEYDPCAYNRDGERQCCTCRKYHSNSSCCEHRPKGEAT